MLPLRRMIFMCFGIVLLFTGCELPIDLEFKENTIDPPNGNGNNNGTPEYDLTIKIHTNGGWTNPYGVFLVDKDGNVKWSSKIESGVQGFHFYKNIPSGSYYLAVLSTPNQSHPIEFDTQNGDYLGWYKENSSESKTMIDQISPTMIYQVYLEKLP